MKVVIVGASGNIGTSLIESLVSESTVREIVGIARRRPRLSYPKTTWVQADITSDPLAHHLEGAEALVHLAWLIQPSHDVGLLHRVNVEGSKRVFDAAVGAGVRNIIYSSSLGTYARGPKHQAVAEEWSPTGIPGSSYSRHKAEVEAILDDFERHHEVRVVRIRPALVFKKEAASEIRRYFLGPLFPGRLASPRWIWLLPLPPGLRFQAVHSRDVGDAFRRALLTDVHGAFNLAADPVLDPGVLARHLKALRLPVPGGLLRGLCGITHRAHLQPVEPGWIELALGCPVMSSDRARTELGWEPEHSSLEALDDLLDGLRKSAGHWTPPLEPHAGGVGRWREVASGVGAR